MLIKGLLSCYPECRWIYSDKMSMISGVGLI